MASNPRAILLIHPLGYCADDAERDIARVVNLMPPLGLCSIAAYLESKGFEADIIDCFAHPHSDDVIAAYLRAKEPAFVGVSCTTSGFPDAIRLLTVCKAIKPDVKAIVGGPHISACKSHILNSQPVIDFAVIGEGEPVVEQLLSTSGARCADIKGLVYRDKDKIIFTGNQGRGMDLDDLPFPAYDKLWGYPEAYELPIFSYPRHPTASCVTSRGCPYACSYCDRSVFGRSFRYNSAAYVYRHMKYLRGRWGIRHVTFYDDQFTLKRERVEELCRHLIDEPLAMTFNCALRAEHVDYELLVLMKRAGCWMASLGVESGDPQLLSRHRDNGDLELLTERVHDIKRAGIRVKGLLMLGLPGESEETVKNSMKYVLSLPIDDLNVAKFTPFPGAPIYERIRELGEFTEDYSKMDCMNFVFVTAGMTRERLEALFIEFYKAHFRRARVVLGYVAMLWKSPHSWWRFATRWVSFVAFARSNERIRGRAVGVVRWKQMH